MTDAQAAMHENTEPTLPESGDGENDKSVEPIDTEPTVGDGKHSVFEGHYLLFKKRRQEARDIQRAINGRRNEIESLEREIKALEEQHKKARKHATSLREELSSQLSDEIRNW